MGEGVSKDISAKMLEVQNNPSSTITYIYSISLHRIVTY
jgi:hypothetical protein